jgi:hypothetical protein
LTLEQFRYAEPADPWGILLQSIEVRWMNNKVIEQLRSRAAVRLGRLGSHLVCALVLEGIGPDGARRLFDLATKGEARVAVAAAIFWMKTRAQH